MSREEISDLVDFYYTALPLDTAKILVDHLIQYTNLK